MTRHDAHLITARPAAMPSQGCTRFAARTTFAALVRAGGGTLSGPLRGPKKSWVALLRPRRGARRPLVGPRRVACMTHEWTRGDYTISTDPRRLDLDVI